MVSHISVSEHHTPNAPGRLRWQAAVWAALLSAAAVLPIHATGEDAAAVSPKFVRLHSFGSGPNDGKSPNAGLVQGSDGNFYGTTYSGGADSRGTVFTITPDGALTTLHSFSVSISEGTNPNAGLVEGSDGNFYGTTTSGGASGEGTAFVVSPGGALQTLHSFTGKGRQGATPVGALVQGSDGNFYGTTESGGTAGQGTVFVMKPGGNVKTLHSFAGADGAQPKAGLIQAKDGDFYGTCYGGGAFGYGTVFSINRAGKLTTLHSFSFHDNDGANPIGRLVQGRNLRFYGATLTGGSFDSGTIFAFTDAATFKTVHVFNGDGTSPNGGLVQGSNDDFYGTASGGGTSNVGIVFEMSHSGTVTVLHDFDGGKGGAYPSAGVIEGNDGNLYGTTEAGGVHDDGTVFRLDVTQ